MTNVKMGFGKTLVLFIRSLRVKSSANLQCLIRSDGEWTGNRKERHKIWFERCSTIGAQEDVTSRFPHWAPSTSNQWVKHKTKTEVSQLKCTVLFKQTMENVVSPWWLFHSTMLTFYPFYSPFLTTSQKFWNCSKLQCNRWNTVFSISLSVKGLWQEHTICCYSQFTRETLIFSQCSFHEFEVMAIYWKKMFQIWAVLDSEANDSCGVVSHVAWPLSIKPDQSTLPQSWQSRLEFLSMMCDFDR